MKITKYSDKLIKILLFTILTVILFYSLKFTSSLMHTYSGSNVYHYSFTSLEEVLNQQKIHLFKSLFITDAIIIFLSLVFMLFKMPKIGFVTSMTILIILTTLTIVTYKENRDYLSLKYLDEMTNNFPKKLYIIDPGGIINRGDYSVIFEVNQTNPQADIDLVNNRLKNNKLIRYVVGASFKATFYRSAGASTCELFNIPNQGYRCVQDFTSPEYSVDPGKIYGTASVSD